MSLIDFLKPDTAQIRHQIRGIIESYSNEWDLVAELAQNAIDAVSIGSASKGHLSITVNATNNTVIFTDNGVGIAKDHLSTLLRPFGTNKYGRADQIGEKGVGVTFVIFSTDEFVIETCHKGAAVRATIKGASNWLNAELESPLLLEEEAITLPSTAHQSR